MKKLLIALSLLIPSIALAEFPGIVNSSQATLYGSQQESGPLAMDTKGNLYARVIDGGSGLSQSVIPVSNNTSLNGLGTAPIGYARATTDAAEAGSTTTVINATAHSARVGDVIQFTSGTATNLDAWSPVSAVTANTITVSHAFPSTVAASDGFYILRPRPLYTSDPRLTGTWAGLQVSIDSGYQTTASGILKLEDAAHTTGDAGVSALAVNLGSAAFAATGAANDYVQFIQDADGRTAVNPFGANTSNFWNGCGTATATTSDVAIKASGGGGVRNYVTSVTCASSDADNATNINFKDGSTVVAVGGVNQMATTSAGTFSAVFSTPIRGTAATAFNFNTAVSTSSVICCATGFTSSN